MDSKQSKSIGIECLKKRGRREGRMKKEGEEREFRREMEVIMCKKKVKYFKVIIISIIKTKKKI